MSQRSARELALTALKRWRTSRQFADEILHSGLRQSDSVARDRAFATELFYGVLRNLTLLDFLIGMLRNGSVDAQSRDLIRLGIYQICFLHTPDHAAVFETVALAPARARAFVNASLRSALRRKSELIAAAQQQPLDVRKSHPAFVVTRWRNEFGDDEATALCDWDNQPAPIYARVNLLKISADEFCERYSDCEPLQTHRDFVRLTVIPGDALARGHCYIQDPSTTMACQLLGPRPGDTTLDACAAPGGKTALLAQMMENRGCIVACDRDAARMSALRDNLSRLGVTNTTSLQHDWQIAEFGPATTFDRILVDSPCSNTGVMRRRVDVRWRLMPENFQSMQNTQLSILRSVIPLLNAGGTLVYSTCSIEAEENGSVVEILIGEFPFLNLTKQTHVLSFRDGFDGAFAARFVRSAV